MTGWRSVTLAVAACTISLRSAFAGDAQVFSLGLEDVLEDVSQLNHTLPTSSYVSESYDLLSNMTTSCTKVQAVSARTPDALKLQHFREEDDWKNSIALLFLSLETRSKMPRMVAAWLRCYVMVNVVYFLTGGMWAYYVYVCWGDKFFAPGNMPALRDMGEQIKVSMLSMPLGLHDVKIGYKVLHYIHHKYNKEHTLSPFAGLAFHPLDGILQAIPYCWLLFFVPMHFLTFELLLFATGVWTTNIHDCIHAKVAPVMGAGYHALHHTVYNKNYGHYFTYMDKLHNTLFTPEEDEERRQQRQK
ncbi:hypothetical protein WJX82_003384 [Trebouxia sp. C0006]